MRTATFCRLSSVPCLCRAGTAVADIGTAREHESVLLEEAVAGLAPKRGGVYVDATFGRGGHTGKILKCLGDAGRVIALDRDPEAEQVARAMMAQDSRLMFYRAPFSQLAAVLEECGVMGQVNGILLDLGVSSPQLDDPSRGFSFRADGPLDMRMGPDVTVNARDWINSAPEDEIAQVLKEYGEERFARRIARAIARARGEQPITTTGQLSALIAQAVPTRERGKDPATRSFQAIRIYINRELEELRAVLPQALAALAPGGRLAVISFHSLEDRIVKQFMRKASQRDPFPPDLPVPESALPQAELRLLGGVIRAGEVEVMRNPRARSAVLRVAERTGTEGGPVRGVA